MIRCALTTFVLVCALPALLKGETFPYEAVVAVEEAGVFSGPGDSFYATDVLPRGSKVAVYRLDNGQWLGIRPPEGSFSWVPAGALELSAESGVARVVRQGTMAWIGARIGRVAQHKWQVKLKQGELVRILSDKRHLASLDDQDESWYKVAPPAGEFRWIHQRHVRRLSPLPSSELAVARSSDDDGPPASQRRSSGNPSADDPPMHGTAVSTDDLQLTELSVRPADHRVPLAGSDGTGSDGTGSDEPGTDRERTTADGFVARDGENVGDAEPRGKTSRGANGLGPWNDQLRVLQLEFASIVARDMRNWDLGPVRKQTESLIAAGKTALERGRARLLLDRIAEFENLQRGKLPASSSTPAAPAATDLLFVPPGSSDGSFGVRREAGATMSSQDTTSTGRTSLSLKRVAAEERYDGVGWLLPVHSQLRIAPRFALTDERGVVLQYVMPAPGRNLHRHLRKQVGIIGQRQSIAGLGAPVLTARNVIELDRHR